METEQQLFTGRALRALIIPLVLEQILGLTVGMADSIMVSSAGEAAVSGVSLVDSINILLVNTFISLSTGGAVVAAHRLGEKKKRSRTEDGGSAVVMCHGDCASHNRICCGGKPFSPFRHFRESG